MKFLGQLLVVYSSIYMSENIMHVEFVKVEMCENKTTPMKAYVSFGTDAKHEQYADGAVFMPLGFRDDMMLNTRIYSMVGNKWIYLFSLKYEKLCSGLSKYVGPLWHDIERRVNLTPGVCPVPAGNYSLKNVYINTKKINFQSLPRTKIRLVADVYMTKTKQLLLCLFNELENH